MIEQAYLQSLQDSIEKSLMMSDFLYNRVLVRTEFDILRDLDVVGISVFSRDIRYVRYFYGFWPKIHDVDVKHITLQLVKSPPREALSEIPYVPGGNYIPSGKWELLNV